MDESKSPQRCYNSGPISSLRYLTALANFRRADGVIARELRMTPVNPMEVTWGLQPSAPWWMHMVKDILLLATCRSVYFQNGWRGSRGARVEYRVAGLLGKEMVFAEEQIQKS